MKRHVAAAPLQTPGVVRDVLRSPGRPLEPAVREEMEARFSHDFSSVRVHTDRQAADSAQAVNAHAYTLGRNVVFGSGLYAPRTTEGRRLLAHELAHTVQQHGATAEAAPVPAGSALESAADSAGRAVASGRSVPQALGTSGVSLARELIGNENYWVPQSLPDPAKVTEFWEIWNRFKNDWYEPNDFAKRAYDRARLEVLVAEAKPHYDARQAAVREAEAVAARMGYDEDEDVAEAQAEVLRIAEKASEPLFQPGGFTDEAIYGEYKQATERLDKELAPAKDPRPFRARFKEAQHEALNRPILPYDEGGSHESIWRYGLSKGLFAEREHDIVFNELDAPARARREEERKRFEIQQEYRQRQQFESFRSQLNLGFIQAALIGRPGVPSLVRGAYFSYGVAQTGVEAYRGIQSGDPTRVVGAALPLVAGYGFLRIAGVGEPPPLPGGGRALPTGIPRGQRGAPVEVYVDDVLAAYAADPTNVGKMMSNSWAQYVWEMHGGEGIHPMAWRHPSGKIIVNELRWPRPLSEINQPHELIVPGEGGQQPSLPQSDPHAPTVAPPAPEPPAPAPDPLAPTGVMPPPRPGPVTAITGPKGQAVEASPGDAVAAYQANPGAVYVGRNSVHHEQIWHLSGGRGATPVVFRSGSAYFVDPELAPPGLLAQIGRAMQLPAVAAPAIPQRPGTVTVELAVQSGLVNPTGNLGRVLQGIQTEYAAGPPKNLNEGLAVVTRGAARAGLHPGRRTQPSATEYQLENVGGIRTRILASGEIIVTNRDGQVVLHLIP